MGVSPPKTITIKPTIRSTLKPMIKSNSTTLNKVTDRKITMQRVYVFSAHSWSLYIGAVFTYKNKSKATLTIDNSAKNRDISGTELSTVVQCFDCTIFITRQTASTKRNSNSPKKHQQITKSMTEFAAPLEFCLRD